MKIVTFCIYITICFLIIGCKKSTSTIRDNAYDSVEKYETELEKLCLESHNGSVTYSIRIKTEDLTNDYEYKYLGSLKIKKNIFKVIQQKILSGQYQDSQRAAVSIRLFLKGKLYGEFTGLNNFYKIKITSNTLCLYNYETKSRSIFELKDSIPNLLFFPYNDKDSLSSGDIFYLIGVNNMLKITVFNITSLTSGALGKEIAPKKKLYPKSYMRGLGKNVPYGNVSQTFNLYIKNPK